MSFEFVISETDPQDLPDGIYIALIRHAEKKSDQKFGDFILIGWEIEEPDAHRGYILPERFFITSSNEKHREVSIRRFSAFAKEMLSLQTGDIITEGRFLSLINKRARISVRKNTGTNGKTYQNVMSRELCVDGQWLPGSGISAETMTYGNIIIPTATPQGMPLNDEVPF